MLQTFAQLLPGEDESRFLLACVDPSEKGQAAWRTWRAQHVLHDELERDGTGYKRLLPLLTYTLEQGGLALNPADVNILRAARMREQLRAEKIRGILRQALTALDRGGIDTILLKGAALSQTVYPHPDLRHTHDIDLLVRVPDLTRAADLLRAHGFSTNPTPPHAQDTDIPLVHSSGLPLILHSTLFQSPAHSLPEHEIWTQKLALSFDGTEAHILSPELNLVHVLGHTFYTHTRRLRGWVADAYFLGTRTPFLNWARVGELAIHGGLALPVFLTLDYLHRALSLPVPQNVLDGLQHAASKMSQREYESALTCMRRNGQGGYRYWLKTAQNPSECLQVARWILSTYEKNG